MRLYVLRNLLISIFLVSGLTLAFAPLALADVNCSVGRCIYHMCQHARGGRIPVCHSYCQHAIADRVKNGQCK
jgi:hypothetical protein